MKQISDDSHTPFDAQNDDAANAAPSPDWHVHAALFGNRLRQLPLSAIVGLSAVGGAMAVILLSCGAGLVTSSLQTAVPRQTTAVVKNKPAPAASAKVYIVPEDKASLPSVQPGLAEASFSGNRQEEVPPETSAETEMMRQRRLEDQLNKERQRLEDRKRIVERELENKEIENKRLQEDKAIEEQRRTDRKRLLEARQEEDKRLSEQAEQEAQRRIDEERHLEEQRKQEEQKMAAVG